ncbi:ion transport protein domain-containing protein [Ditylenchus destructor]|uniref:Ion transport protein domain-containing protein n=1 Tax=Ditylenchus destructor TaxID=166010 RepID=A0AAD4NIG2_9BILA|nr:ion transport protein domain-containing protein [Ditylenchus destructor]
MGISSSTVTAGIKNQVDGRSNTLYQMADVKGTGELALLAKEALKLGDTTALDKIIKLKIKPLLYNDGEGAMLPIEEVIAIRHKERTGNVFTNVGVGSTNLRKFICWRLDARGAVGETLLHVCFLSGLPAHMKLLALRLLYNFPKIINDFYICDEYYGETALHMGIVGENPEIVRIFRTDSADFEHALLARHTNYTGHLYWGEYPLSFAACLSEKECFRLLGAYGADPNWQDTNGNTVLHICTIRENWRMFELALNMGANLHIQNRQRLTPLTLSAFLAKKEMFERIVEVERQVYWTYGGVLCAAYPLEHLDSIEPSTGKLNRNSALTIIVYGNSAEHLSLLPNLLEELVHKKWITYARQELFRQLWTFIAYFSLVFICFLIRPTPFERQYHNMTLICLFNLPQVDYLELSFRELVYTLLNYVVFVCAIFYLLQMRMHIKNVGKAMYFLSLSGFPAKAIFLVSCVLVIVSFVLRTFCWNNLEDIVWEITILLTAIKFLFYCRGFKSVGPFVLMLYKIILRDLSRFFIIYLVIVIGFSQSFYIIFLGYRRNDPHFNVEKEGTIMLSVPESFIRMFIMSLTEFTVLFEHLEQCDLATIGKITFVVFILFVTMLLINMLIAMMTNTYTEVSASSLEWLRQWSAIILLMEQSFDPETRMKYQKHYSIPMEDGKRIALLLKLRMTDEEMRDYKRRMQKRRIKLKEKK